MFITFEGPDGGGKTTLFEAIYGALYGLNIHNTKQFKELLNAGALGKEDEKIIFLVFIFFECYQKEFHRR